MSAELLHANEKWLSFDKPLKEMYSYYKNVDEDRRTWYDNPNYATKSHLINAFDKCVNGEIEEWELFRWVHDTIHCGSIEVDPRYKNLIGGIYGDFEDFEINPDEEMPDQAYVKETLEKLRNAQPETLA